MKRARTFSVVFVCIISFVGLVRGYRMIVPENTSNILFPFPEEMISFSLFSNYTILGWILFFMLGIFGLFILRCIYTQNRIFPYLVIILGIFASFLTLTHMLYGGFAWIHLLLLPISLGTILLGVVQTPKEF
jgi:hypothetical protein